MRAATEFAANCFLAFDVRADRRLEGHGWAVPKAAIISATKFGDRPASRPPSARPAEHAAYDLKTRWGFPNPIVHDYLEALLDRPTLDPWEVRKRFRGCKEREVTAARAAGHALLNGVSEESLRKQLVEAERLDAEIASLPPSRLLPAGAAAHIARRRIEVFPQIRAGKMDPLPPLVQVLTRSSLGRDLPMSSGGRLKVEWSREAVEQSRPAAAALLSLPGWYPYWVGLVTPCSPESKTSTE